jgi:primosomal protein N' (replication factor Y)
VPAENTPGLFPELHEEPQSPAAPALAEGVYCVVALNKPVQREFTYGVPPELADRVAVGARVAVPFGRRREVGVCVGTPSSTDVPPARLRPIADVLDPEPVVDGELLELTRWMAGYYACSWGEALAALLPAGLKREGGGRKVSWVRPAEGIGREELASLEERWPQQHRTLRTLLDASGPLERQELLNRTNLSVSPLTTLVRKGWVMVERVDAEPDELLTAPSAERTRPERLTDAQAAAVTHIGEYLAERRAATVLLYGVTGSGKTEVYLRIIEDALARGRGAIVLVPEIALTPQTVGWFRSRFGEVAVLHSRMTDAQRLATWRRVRRGECRVVVGARSALFAPVADLGVIVVDEEHEPSFKQASSPRYHGRDLAVVRARKADAVCVLGSATPSLESWRNAAKGRYDLLRLDRRVHGGDPPPIEVVDMRREVAETKSPALFSRRLVDELRTTLEKKEQAILFLNRRGWSPVLWCRECGETAKCRQCDVPLNYHRRLERLVCHACCEELRVPRVCPCCTAPGLRFLGAGSEKVDDALGALFPGARVGRMDSDTMLRREDYERTLSAFGRRELDVLVGTQMIAKGLDFPRVTLVGIVSADSALHLPDFRAAERTFQLVSQVSGRAGRGDLAGRIVVQTIAPEHPAIVHAARHDYESFVQLELAMREELGYPPGGRLIRVLFEDKDPIAVKETAARFGDTLFKHVTPEGGAVLGPTEAPMALVRGRTRHHLLIKAAEGSPALARARTVLLELAAGISRPRVTIDVDPVGML